MRHMYIVDICTTAQNKFSRSPCNDLTKKHGTFPGYLPNGQWIRQVICRLDVTQKLHWNKHATSPGMQNLRASRIFFNPWCTHLIQGMHTRLLHTEERLFFSSNVLSSILTLSRKAFKIFSPFFVPHFGKKRRPFEFPKSRPPLFTKALWTMTSVRITKTSWTFDEPFKSSSWQEVNKKGNTSLWKYFHFKTCLQNVNNCSWFSSVLKIFTVNCFWWRSLGSSVNGTCRSVDASSSNG